MIKMTKEEKARVDANFIKRLKEDLKNPILKRVAQATLDKMNK